MKRGIVNETKFGKILILSHSRWSYSKWDHHSFQNSVNSFDGVRLRMISNTVVCVILCSSVKAFTTRLMNSVLLSVSINLSVPHREITKSSNASQILVPVAELNALHSTHFVKSWTTKRYWNPALLRGNVSIISAAITVHDPRCDVSWDLRDSPARP